MYKITDCTLEAFFISTLSRFQDFIQIQSFVQKDI